MSMHPFSGDFNFTSATGDSMRPLYVLRVKLKWNKYVGQHDLFVYDKLDNNLLGSDILEASGANIQYVRNSNTPPKVGPTVNMAAVQMHRPIPDAIVKLCQSQSVAPRSHTLLKVHVPEPFKDAGPFIVPGNGLHLHDSLVNVKGSEPFSIPFFNADFARAELNRGDVISFLSPVDPSSISSSSEPFSPPSFPSASMATVSMKKSAVAQPKSQSSFRSQGCQPITSKNSGKTEVSEVKAPPSPHTLPDPPSLPPQLLQRKREWVKLKAQIASSDPTWKNRCLQVLLKHARVFQLDSHDLGRCELLPARVPYKKEAGPVWQKQFVLSHLASSWVRSKTLQMLKNGLIEPSSSPFNTPLAVVLKPQAKEAKLKAQHERTSSAAPNHPAPPTRMSNKDLFSQGDTYVRLVWDLRAINANCVDLPTCFDTIEVVLENLARANATIYATLDMASAYQQIALHPDDRWRCAFTVHGLGRFQSRVLPAGLKSAPQAFSAVTNLLFSHLPNVIAYLDDIIVFSSSPGGLLHTLDEVLSLLGKADLRLKVEKSRFMATSVDFLGFRISPDGVRPASHKLLAVQALQPPSSRAEIASVVGFMNFFRRWIPNFATLSGQLTSLTRQDSSWQGPKLPPSALEAFSALKQALLQAPLLSFPCPGQPFQLYTDAASGSFPSGKGLGAVLLQGANVISFFSRALKGHEASYSTFSLELAAVVSALHAFDAMVCHSHITIYVDHYPLLSLNNPGKKTMCRLASHLLDYNFTLVYKKEKSRLPKGLALADYLSRSPVPSSSFQSVLCPKSHCSAWDDIRSMVYDTSAGHQLPATPSGLATSEATKPSSTPSGAKPPQFCAVSVESKSGAPFSIQGSQTALLPACWTGRLSSTGHGCGVQESPDAQILSLLPFSSSELIPPATGLFTPAAAPTKSMAALSLRLREPFLSSSSSEPGCLCDVVPTPAQRENCRIYSLSTRFNSLLPANITKKHFQNLQQSDPFCRLLAAIKAGREPARVSEADKKLAQDCLKTAVFEDDLWWMPPPSLNLPSLPGSQRPDLVPLCPLLLKKTTLALAHAHPFSGHRSYNSSLVHLSKAVTWPSVKRDLREFIASCMKCVAGSTPRNFNTGRFSLVSPDTNAGTIAPFAIVHLDVLQLPESKGYKYVLGCIDAVSRFCILIPARSKQASHLAELLLRHVIAVFSAPALFITDGDRALAAGAIFQEMVRVLKTRYHITSAYSHKSNGLIERVFALTHSFLRKVPDHPSESWVDLLPAVMLATNSSVSRALLASPLFYLTGRDAPPPQLAGYTHLSQPPPAAAAAVVGKETAHAAARLPRLFAAREKMQQALKLYTDGYLQKLNKGKPFPPFKIGQKALLHFPRSTHPSANSKNIRLWSPVVIEGQRSQLTFSVRPICPKTFKPFRNKAALFVHSDRLRPWHLPNATALDEELKKFHLSDPDELKWLSLPAEWPTVTTPPRSAGRPKKEQDGKAADTHTLDDNLQPTLAPQNWPPPPPAPPPPPPAPPSPGPHTPPSHHSTPARSHTRRDFVRDLTTRGRHSRRLNLQSPENQGLGANWRRDRSTSGSSRSSNRGALANAELFLRRQGHQSPSSAAADPDATLTESKEEEEEASSNDASPDDDDSFVSAAGTPGPRL